MMNREGYWTGKVLGAMKKAFTAVACAGMIAIMSHAPALAHEEEDDGFIAVEALDKVDFPNAKHFKYGFYNAPEQHLGFEAAWEAMTPAYEVSRMKFSSDKENRNAPIFIMAEFDLNNDDIPELISYPIQDAETMDIKCKKYVCPGFVTDMSSKKPRVLLQVTSYLMDRGDEIKNGYWTLKVFTKQDDPANFDYFDLYAYNPKTGKYEITEKPVKPDKDTKDPQKTKDTENKTVKPSDNKAEPSP